MRVNSLKADTRLQAHCKALVSDGEVANVRAQHNPFTLLERNDDTGDAKYFGGGGNSWKRSDEIVADVTLVGDLVHTLRRDDAGEYKVFGGGANSWKRGEGEGSAFKRDFSALTS